MLLRAAPAFSLLGPAGDSLSPPPSSSPAGANPAALRFSSGGHGGSLVVCASKESNSRPLTGVVFQPFEEVKKELDLVPTVPQASLARHKFVDECEAAINEQIKYVSFLTYELVGGLIWLLFMVGSCRFRPFGLDALFFVCRFSVEYNVSYVYHSMYAYFDRDNVALKGLAK